MRTFYVGEKYKLAMKIRSVEKKDVENTYLLFMDQSVRAAAKNPDAISFEDHEKWFNNRIGSRLD